MIGLQQTITLPQALAQMLTLLGTIRDEIRNLRTAEPAQRPANRAELLLLSNAGNTQGKTPSVELHITGLFLSADTSGRCTLQIGTYLLPFYLPSNLTQFYRLSEDDQIVVKNDRVTFNPPSGTTNWDVTIIGHARA